MEKKIREYISGWEQKCYHRGIPDETPLEIKDLVPSYKKIAIAILNNDHGLKSLGLTPKKSIYYHQLKKIEIEARNKDVTKK